MAKIDDMPDVSGGNAIMTPVTVTTTGNPVLTNSPNRRALVIPAPLTNRITYGYGSIPVLDQGLTMYPNQIPIILDRSTHGALVTRELFAISAVASQVVGLIEEIGS